MQIILYESEKDDSICYAGKAEKVVIEAVDDSGIVTQRCEIDCKGGHVNVHMNPVKKG
jgi:hypothetical protein